MANAILTIATNDQHKEILAETMSLMRQYAKRCGADFIAITSDDPSYPIAHYRKLREIQTTLIKYDRVAWVDADVLIGMKAPNIFDEVPEDSLGIFNEATWIDRSKDAAEWQELTGFALPANTYYNTGVMVIPKSMNKAFDEPEVPINHYGEQTFLNMSFAKNNCKIYKLSHHWNRMSCTHMALGEEPFCSHFIHFAGQTSDPKLPSFIKKTVEHWGKQNWTGEKRVAIITNMGMGNQIASEPAIRHLMDLHPDYKFVIQSHFTDVYDHLKKQGVEVIGADKPIGYPFALKKSTAFSGVIQDVASHPLDYHAQALLQRQLPLDAKRIKVPVEDCGTRLLPYTVVIHAGRSGWASKEMPEEMWQAIADELKAEGINVAIIGTRDFKHKNKLYKEGEKWGCFQLKNVHYDLTDLPYAKTCDVIRQGAYLLTNDSMPVHAAGAFDNHIGLITIAKRPELILPYRNGDQWKNTTVWTGTPLWEVTKEIAVFNPDQTFSWADMWKGMRWPDPDFVAGSIIGTINSKRKEKAQPCGESAGKMVLTGAVGLSV